VRVGGAKPAPRMEEVKNLGGGAGESFTALLITGRALDSKNTSPMKSLGVTGRWKEIDIMVNEMLEESIRENQIWLRETSL
jgi:hypothetical protein